jgi:hypothetical protein
MYDTATSNQIGKKWILLTEERLADSKQQLYLTHDMTQTRNLQERWRRTEIWSIEWILMGNTGVWFVIVYKVKHVKKDFIQAAFNVMQRQT